ncbi:MAG: T9SS type A sorting domain-containing protein [Prolixibacteraceae bacterium]|nr:T9SS type A sorting domain-containing protein [Prolixibacteraceae bacterium]
MKNKILLFLFISLFGMSAAFAQDATAIWNPSENENTTLKWTETANWYLLEGEGYPNDIEAANAEIGTGDYPATMECIVDDSVNVFNLKVGNGGDEEAVLRIQKGGFVHTGKWWSGIAWSSPGKLIVEKGGAMTFGEHFWIGWNADGVAIIEGTVNVTAMYGGGAFGGNTGVSNTFVKNGGVLNLSQLNPEKSFTEGSFIDISGGTLNFKTTAAGAEEAKAVLQAFIDSENITAYEGNGELTLTYVATETDTVIRVTDASVVYQVNLSEVTDQKDGGKVFVMLGDGSDYEEMFDENNDGIYIASVSADRVADLTYWFEYENANARTIEDLTGKDCASGSKRAIDAVPENNVLTLPAVLFNSCDEAADAVQQATTEWTGAESGLWSVPANWSDGFVPNDNKVVFKNPAAPECVLNVESTIKQFVLGDGGEASTLKVVDGGTLTTTEGWSGIGWTAPATMIVEQGGTVNFAEHAWIGWESDATLTIDGGTINVAGMYGTAFEGGAGTGTVSIKNGGILNLTGLDGVKSIPDGSTLDIAAGTVKILGDKVDIVNAYAAAGRITGYGGQGTITATLSGDSTVVVAIPGRQATTVWNPAGNPASTGLWSEAANWSDFNVPMDNKVVFNVVDAPECVLNDSSTIKQFVLGDGADGAVLRVADGGTLTTGSEWSAVAWSNDATLIVETGGTVNFGSHAWIGWNGDATLQLNGGTINVAGMYGTAFEGGTGKGFVTINSGTLNLTGFDAVKSIPDSSFMDIKAGTVTIQGDMTAAVNAYADANKITAYEGNGQLNVVFADGVTTITATAVRGATTVWNPAANPASTGLWSEAMNWTDGMVPDSNKVVFNVPDARECVLNTESTIKQFVLGDGGDGGTLRVANGGTLTTTAGWSGIGWSAPATLIVDEGGTVNFAEHAWIGWDGAATLILNGGTINVAGMYGTAFEGQAGSATVSIKKGVLNLAQLDGTKSIPDGSVMDVELGVVKITGDKVAVVNAYKDAGKITAFNGTGTLDVSFADGATTIMAIPEKGNTTVWDPATNPGTSAGLWSESLNWSDRHVPDANKVVFKVTGAQECILNIEDTIKQLVLGDGGESMQTLHIVNGGSLTTTNGWSGIGWNSPGTLIVDTGAVFNFGSHAWVGWNSDAVIQINGGIVNVGGMYGTAFEGQSGTGSVYVNSGELNLAQIHPEKSIPEGSVLDIKEGKVTIVGNQLDIVNAYIAAGKITAYGGSGQLFVNFIDGFTIIDAKDWAVANKDMENAEFKGRVYPNPTQGRITIENPSNSEFNYTIYNITGKLMLLKNNISGPSIQVDLTGMVNGIYLVNVSSAEKSVMHKIILK